MSYFKSNYSFFKYPISGEDTPGFRRAQIGAIHSAAGHFANRTEPAIITMPTGSGKTAVLIASAFVLRATRVLIITPSRLVREQIAEETANLVTLKETGALPQDISLPSVMSTDHRVTSNAAWEEMRNYDVVVATIQSISPEYEDIPEPPKDLFDLVLVDEAHHAPARTWQAILDHFSDAKRLLFTATPFRQDQKEIKGRFIFTYDLRDAYSDGIFGDISFQPVTLSDGETHDEAIARAAEQQFQRDRDAGFNHRLMVRTDGVPRAEELEKIYERTTSLRLSIIKGSHSLRYVKRVIRQLDVGELDGIICVNMLGEGFNFPSLKIAAIHSPHKSLSVTLQFVGRFARTAGVNLGPATFLAIPSDVEIEAERLYDKSAVWQEIIHNLAALRVTQELEVREILQSFQEVESSPDLSDLSLYVLEPYYHVKVYQLETGIDIEREVEFPSGFQTVYHGVSLPHNASIYITRKISLPRWTIDDRLSNVESDLFIFYFDRATNLFFVCASRRSEGIYEELMESFADAGPRPLPLVRLNKALNDLASPEFFNVGMRNRVASNTTESYRIISGSNADRSVQKSDGRLYHRGHVFGRGLELGNSVTIGLSSASKVWSNKSSQLPELISWCARLAQKISSNRVPVTNSGLDYLDTGEEITALPNNVVAVNWPASVYRKLLLANFTNSAGQNKRIPLLDFEISLDTENSTKDALLVEIKYEDITYRLTYSFVSNRFFEPASENEPNIYVENDRASFPLIDFLNQEMLSFYTSDLSHIEGFNIVRASKEPILPFEDRAIEVTDWARYNTNIRREYDKPDDVDDGRCSIHTCIETILATSDADIVYYDHGTGEVADFVSFKRVDDRILITLYHCKKSASDQPSHRLEDLYELASQTVKSVVWAKKDKIFENIRRRFNDRTGGHRFIVGDLDQLEQLLHPISSAQVDFEFVLVQPGLKKEGITEELSNILASASDYLLRGNYKAMRVMSS